MKIIALDTWVTDFDGLEWKGMHSLGAFDKFDHSRKKEVVSRSIDANAVIINKVVFDKDVISQLPKLKYIGLTATGTNNVDLKCARKKGIVVTNVPAYSTSSVAQMTFAIILEIYNRVFEHHLSVKKGDWEKSETFCYQKIPIQELTGKRLGILGFGAIGQKVGAIGKAFGMELLIANLPGRPPKSGRVSLDTFFHKADVITLHCPLTSETNKLINKLNLSKMKKTAILINTARGNLVDEPALADALLNHQIAYAGVDVLSSEPPKGYNPLINAPNILITPHIAWGTRRSRERLVFEATNNLKAFIGGELQNVVN